MLRVFPRSVRAAASRSWSLLRDRRGAAAIELAVTVPVFLSFAIGTLKFGVAMAQYLTLNNAAAQGAMTIGMSRGAATPYATTTTAINNAAPNLTAGSLTKTVRVNGTSCTTDSTCATALVAGATASVTVSYPCDLTVMGVNFKPSCRLSASSAMMVQ